MSDSARQDAIAVWLDDEHPHEESASRAQIETLSRLLEPAPRRVLDLGCGAGRILIPLARAGHEIVGIDQNAASLARTRQLLEEDECAAELVDGDFLQPWTYPENSFDVVLCLGNTLMTIVDVDQAVTLFRRIASVLRRSGWLAVDDCPADFWPELAEGNWQNGISPDGTAQMVWDPSDAVFALRSGDAIDPERWHLTPADRRLRLWTDGTLHLVAAAAGLSAPARTEGGHVLLMHAEPE